MQTNEYPYDTSWQKKSKWKDIVYPIIIGFVAGLVLITIMLFV